ncbi:unnamed protein product [Protopolystoma xenopodis]|uniref:Uncharacterized protein n=1 Tax=Protopolystoma xenopodis TaxID=117903 RepID=A0A3S5BAR2_9PLAT|nr:unnamed protein product [Protopolystoma xenopodis]
MKMQPQNNQSTARLTECIKCYNHPNVAGRGSVVVLGFCANWSKTTGAWTTASWQPVVCRYPHNHDGAE